MALTAGIDMPKYLLAPEVAVLLCYLPDLRQRLLIETMWNTGARLNEALALTPASFCLGNTSRPFLTLATLKQRQIVTTRKKGRPTAREQELVKQEQRIVPLYDPAFVQRLEEYFVTMRPKVGELLWPVASDETPRNWLRAAVQRAERDGVTFSLPSITPITFRHSFAMHLISRHMPLKALQTLMGHKSLSSTEWYTKVFALDVGHQVGVAFSMSAGEALALISQAKGR